VAAETLPVTGSETLPLLAVGVVLLAGGLMLVRWSNRVA
jgi:LPXTG-motif cell wall-anchored protein